MLRDEVIKYYYPPNGYNYSCSESMLRAVSDYFRLDLPEETFFAASSFSGGCGHDELCGGLASALAVIGILYSVGGHAHDSDTMRAVRKELFDRFEEKYPTSRCLWLKEHHFIPVHKCESILADIADILEELLQKYEYVNPRG